MSLPESPNSNVEQYLSKISGQTSAVPEAPNSRVEQYLDYIAQNGTVSKEEIAEQVSEWLEENIHEDPTVVIDASLSVSGAAADAKATGDDIGELRADLNDVSEAIYGQLTLPGESHSIIQGSYNSSGSATSATNRIRISDFVDVKAGQVLRFSAGTNIKNILIGWFTTASQYISDSAWYGDGSEIGIASDGKIVIVFKNESGSAITPSDYDATTILVWPSAMTYDSVFQKRTIDATEAAVGRALADGSIRSRTDTKYIMRTLYGVTTLSVKTSFWGSDPVVVFYGSTGDVVSTVSTVNGTHDYGAIPIPSTAVKYAVNVSSDYASTFAVKEIVNHIDVLSNGKQDKVTNVTITSANAVTGRALSDGTFTTQSNTKFIKRSCIGIESLNVSTALWGTPKVVFYDEDGDVVSYVDGSSGAYSALLSIPSTAVSYAVNCANDQAWLNTFSVVETWYLLDIVEKVTNVIDRIEDESAKGKPGLVLPEWYPAVVGFPAYLYYENVLKNGYLDDFVLSKNGVKANRYCDVRTPEAVGDTTVTVNIFNGNSVMISGSTVMKAVAANTSGMAKCLIIGDSKTAAQAPWNTLHELLENDANMSMTFLGTVTSGYINREGYSGKSIIDVCDSEYITGTTPNIFYDSSVTTENGHHFSFAKAVETLGDMPDIVFIDHGANQTSKAWSTVKGCYDDIISSIHAVDSDIIIVIVVQEGTALLDRPNYTTDGKWWLENASYTNAEKLLTEYKNRESENVFVQPQYICMDLYRDFPICKLPSSVMSYGEREFCVDDIHPGLNTVSWSSATNYKYGDWVARNGNGYGCKKANTNVDPEVDNGTYWAKCENLNDGYAKKDICTIIC